MTRTKRFLRAMALASFLIGAGSASAADTDPQAPMPPMGQHDGWQGMRDGEGFGMSMHHGMLPLRGLKLSDAQQDKVFQLVYAAEPAMYQKMKALRATRESLRSAAGISNYDPAKVKQLAEQQGRQMADLIAFRAELRHKIYGVLTVEQQLQLKKREDWREHHLG